MDNGTATYQLGNISSLTITEVNQCWAWSVFGCGRLNSAVNLCIKEEYVEVVQVKGTCQGGLVYLGP